MRTGIYARYSSENQREASIEDQVRICQARAEKEGWRVTELFSDQAISGATTLRPGYQALLAAVRGGGIDMVLAESLDRFSRDLEHIAAFYKLCVFNSVTIHTLSEGQVSELHIGLKGTMGALYLKDLADKTRRGLEGRIHAGRCIGAPPYGYVVVRKLKEDGELDRGLRAIDSVQAAIVQRIFKDYADGLSPHRIAKTLNAEQVPGPGGGIWYDASIRGREKRRDGILRNAIYVGRIVWRRRLNLKDPGTGATVRRDAHPDTYVTTQIPHLRILDDAAWERAQIRLAAEAAPPPARATGTTKAFWDRRRPRHLLSGKVICGACGRSFIPVGKDYLRCLAAKHGACENTRSIRRYVLEKRVLALMNRELMQPELVREFIAAFQEEWQRLAGEVKAQGQLRVRERAALDRKIENLVEAISDGRSSAAVLAKLKDLEGQRDRLGPVNEPLPGPAMLHPKIASAYARRMGDLTTALLRGEDPAGLEIARGLIEKVVVHPPKNDGDPPEVELIGGLVELLKFAGLGQKGNQEQVDSNEIDPALALFVSSVKEAPGAKPLAFACYATKMRFRPSPAAC